MSIAHPDSPTAKFTNVDTGESVTLEYEYPFTDISSGSRTVSHDVIGAEPVVQHLGVEARSVDFRGHCYTDESQVIDNLSESSVVRVRSHRFTGYGIVERATTNTTGEGGGKRDDISERVLDYRISLVETQAPSQ